MPKMKSNRGAAKRFKRSGGSRIKRASANRRHILTKMSRARKRRLRAPQSVGEKDMAAIKKLLPYT